MVVEREDNADGRGRKRKRKHVFVVEGAVTNWGNKNAVYVMGVRMIVFNRYRVVLGFVLVKCRQTFDNLFSGKAF